MKLSRFIAPLLLALLAACSGPSRDAALEERITNLIEADEIVAINNFGQIAINISSAVPFNMKQKARADLAETIALTAQKMHPDTNAIVVGFAKLKPEIQQIGYGWENKDGKLSPIPK